MVKFNPENIALGYEEPPAFIINNSKGELLMKINPDSIEFGSSFQPQAVAEALNQAWRGIREDKPNLGLATTQELIEELAARARVSQTIGESWPLYRTVDHT